jgi:hypothetical protein
MSLQDIAVVWFHGIALGWSLALAVPVIIQLIEENT